MIRSGYSFKTAVGHVNEIIDHLKEIGATYAPIADRCSTFSFVKWRKLATKAELKPIYGVELAVTPAMGAKKPILDYWTFLAKDNLVSLHNLIALATSNPGKEPSLTYNQAITAEGVFKIAGERLLIGSMGELNDLEQVTVPDDLFVALSPALPRGLYRAAVRAGLKFAARSNNYYTRTEDREFFRVALGKRANTQSGPQHILTRGEWYEACAGIADDDALRQATQNTANIFAACTADLAKATLLTPEKPKSLRDMCLEGAAALNCDLTRPAYKERLDHELAMIAEKKFEDYFYIVADLVQWAKTRMVVGPGRGSSGGSLVCYLLRITAVDPIYYGLLFERFIDLSRNDLPDIDIDFSDKRRDMMFRYAEEKYGKHRVARLGTVGMFKPKSALNQVGTALRIPKHQINKIADSMIHRNSGDSRANQQIEDTLNETEAGRAILLSNPEVMIAARMEAHPNNASQHAAGIVLTEENVKNFVAVDMRTRSTMCDKRDAEDLNLLKIDALGLKQLSIFERTIELIGDEPTSAWLEAIPMNDEAAFKILNDGFYSGVFQFTGRSLKSLAKESGVGNIEDMISINALARPGPMGTGGARSWAKRRMGVEPVNYPHPMLKPYLESTYGILTMQEQVMLIGRELGDLSWKEVTALRKAMSKSLGPEYFDQFGDKWKAGAIAKGLPPEVAQSFWKDLCAFGLYGFNRSHAVAYSIVSYWCCWFKAHHPLEFAAATLDAESEPQRQIEVLRELEAEGVTYCPVSMTHSGAQWQPATLPNGSRTLMGPLTNVKGIGPAALQAILEARRFGQEIPARYRKLFDAPKTDVDSIYPVRDRVAVALPDLKSKVASTPIKIVDLQLGFEDECCIIAVVTKIAPRDENEAVNVAKRGYAFGGDKTHSLGMFVKDDSDEIFCRIDRYDYDDMGMEVINRGRAGRAVYAVKGRMPRGNFRMLKVTNLRYLCDMEDNVNEPNGGNDPNYNNENTGVA